MNVSATTLLCLLLAATTMAQPASFHWLEGTWKVKDKEIYEIWSVRPGGELSGYSFRLNASDTIATETVSLKLVGGAYHYIADVAGGQPPVDFIITFMNDDSFIAENPNHDFPKLIRYQYRKTDKEEQLQASIEGGGKVIHYPFYKLK